MRSLLERPSRRFFQLIILLFASEWIWLSIEPVNQLNWLIENTLVFITLALLLANLGQSQLSKLSYLLIFSFLGLHEIGAHYTYSLVPYNAFFENLTGLSIDQQFSLQRNYFDRLLHFAFGLLLFYPIYEALHKTNSMQGIWQLITPLTLLMSAAGIFEVIEWLVIENVGAEVGMLYLGAQGDAWDAQKDIALAGAGGCLALLSVIAVQWKSISKAPLQTAKLNPKGTL